MAKIDRAAKVQLLADFDAQYAAFVTAGMDEAGRGPLVGNVVAACVVMPKEPLILWVDDSKKLSEKRRESVYAEIMERALYVGIGQATPEEIDRMNILEATKKAMREAASQVPAEVFLIDAVKNLGLNGREIPMVKGDATSYAIAASSIVAKVTRDRQMLELDKQYPAIRLCAQQGLRHAGAYRRLAEIWCNAAAPPDVHRPFCAGGGEMKRYDAGIQGEQEAENALTRQGMTLRTRRYRAEDGEIDLVMQDGETIVFVEVKARPQSRAGQGMLAVTPAKQRRICHAAMHYLLENDCTDVPARFDVVEITRDGLIHVKNAFMASM